MEEGVIAISNKVIAYMGLDVNIFTFAWSEVGARKGRLREIGMVHLIG